MSEHKEEITLRFLVLIGNSGSGKSVLAQKLSQEHPELFTTAVQVTTRPRRENTYDPYVFLDKYQYQQLTPLLYRLLPVLVVKIPMTRMCSWINISTSNLLRCYSARPILIPQRV